MQPKTPTPMQCFNSGVCSFHSENEDGNLACKLPNIRFCERTVGFKRFFTAAAAQTEIQRVIRVPRLGSISPHDVVLINGVTYRIVQLQHVVEVVPSVMDISLRQVEMHMEEEGI